MPYLPHVRLTARFNLGASATPVEQASCSLNFHDVGVPLTAGNWQLVCNDAFDDWAAWVQRSTSKVMQSVKLMDVRLYHIDADGHSVDDTIISAGTPVSGVMTNDQHPFQCSIVTTLEAGTRGLGRFGRIYLPPCGVGIGQDGLMDGSTVNGMFTSVKTLLSDLSNLPGIDAEWGLVVAGRTGSGTLRPVDRVRMGKVMDTQRRRRRSLVEGYLSDAFTP